MSVRELVGRNQKQALLTLHHGNEAVLDLMKPFAGLTRPVWRMARDLPYADRLPTAHEAVEQWFGFFEDVLREEREFVLRVVGMVPERRTAAPTVKPAPKAA